MAESPPVPKDCRSCGARIYWAQTPEGKAMPVDAAPVENGNIELFRRRGGRAVHARVLSREDAEAHTMKAIEDGRGPRLRTSHFVTCPQAASHRRSRA